MLEPDRQEPAGVDPLGAAPADRAAAGEEHTAGGSFEGAPADESLVEKLAALIDNARNYAEAELGFQKTRAALTGKNAAGAVGFVVLALILLHIAIISLAVGLVIALAPFVTIWGAIAIVVGLLLAGTAFLAWRAVVKVRRIAAMFDSANTMPSEPETRAS